MASPKMKSQLQLRQQMLDDVYRILVFTLGEPPVKFDWEYTDDNHQYHIERDFTPQIILREICWHGILENYLSLINSPTDDKPYNHVYTVDLLGNVVGGRQVRHLNLKIDDFKALAVKQLQAGETVWFGSDVGKSSDRKEGIMDTDVYQKDDLLGR
jgi:bleomycin hydrolase